MKRGVIILLAIFILSITAVYAAEDKFDLRACKGECRSVQKETLALCKENYKECRSGCDDRECRRECSKERSSCIKESSANYRACQKDCRAESMPKCLDGNYSYGETFAQGCEICECKSRGRVSCKREAFCNLDVDVEEESCVEAGGFYQALCNGPYFGIVCSQQKFCLCGGDLEYSCPAEYTCLMDFVSPNKRKTLEGWKTLRGEALGSVGVCGV